jgi:hypothetical protein
LSETQIKKFLALRYYFRSELGITISQNSIFSKPRQPGVHSPRRSQNNTWENFTILQVMLCIKVTILPDMGILRW